MMSVLCSSNDGRVVPPPDRLSSAVEEEKSAVSTSGFGFSGDFGFGSVASSDEAARVGGGGSDETRIPGNVSDSRVLQLENEENKFSGSGGGENQHSPSACRLHGTSKKNSSLSGMLEHKKDMSAAEDYDSILSAFDQFAAKGNDETVGYGFKIGDMVWGKVKSHPWWPGHIYNEALASSSVRRGKHEGHVLVAFFGDSSYGWFDPEELILFEENFAEKSRQTTARSFVKAVEEAADELARRSSLGLACRCRNEFNFSPSSVDGYFLVDVGDPEAGVYSLSQIRKAQDSFRPNDLVSFLHEVALNPMNGECWSVDFIKQKAAALDIRKVFFEDYDETYAQAFGTQPMRPPRPTAPVAVDPSKAPLSGPLVIAETLGKGKISVKHAKTKGHMENESFLFTRREDSVQMKSKKASASQLGHSLRQLSVDGKYSGIRNHAHQPSESCFADDQHQLISRQTSINIKSSESSRKLIEGGTKKVKFLKRPAGEFISDNAIRVKKKQRKGIGAEIGEELRELPPAVSDSTVARKKVSRMPVHVHPIDNSGLENQKIDADVGLSSSQSQQEVGFAKIELQMLARDLRALALDPFHGEKRSCPAVIKQIFLRFRSLVYQKSLVLVPSAESEASEGKSGRLSVAADKTNDKIVKPSVRVDDPTKGGKKRSLPNQPEVVQKKKLGVSVGVKRKKVDDFLDSKKKKIDNSKSLRVEKKILQKFAETQPVDVRDSDVRVVPATTIPLKAVKQESSKRTAVQMARAATPTMLYVKFPDGAALPSIPQLKAKFARFGPLDQSGTRVFWKTHTCRVIYQHKIDAQAALKFAVATSSNLFGNTNVRCYIREVGVEATDSEPVKPQKEDTSSVVEPRMVAKTASQPVQHQQSSAQLKSCLKKPGGDEGGNGGGRSARVKFVLGGGKDVDEVPANEYKKNSVASFGQIASSILSSVDSTSKILPKINPQLSNSFSSPFQQQAASVPCPEQGLPIRPRASQTTTSLSTGNDISEQMLNLLMRCNDVVNNLSGAFGCIPYFSI